MKTLIAFLLLLTLNLIIMNKYGVNFVTCCIVFGFSCCFGAVYELISLDSKNN